MSDDNLKLFLSQQQPGHRGYINSVFASFGQSLVLLLRQRRIIFATFICFLPIVIPLMLALISSSQFGESGKDTFTQITMTVYVSGLTPLLALFFATMLIGQDVEAHTIPYILTRPLPRSAWVIGRFLAYMMTSSGIMGISLALLFGSCTTLQNFGFESENIRLVTHFWVTTMFGLLGYGSLTMFLGAFSKRPIIIGVILIYAWQPLAMVIPGYIDFLTIGKYVDAIQPSTAMRDNTVTFQTELGDFQKHIFAIELPQAMLTLAIISLAFVIMTVISVRHREYASAHAIGG
ncbi:MAG: ABC transporter permease [Candidatus Hydrogenedentota bacterium]